jgi:hypothetical protein
MRETGMPTEQSWVFKIRVYKGTDVWDKSLRSIKARGSDINEAYRLALKELASDEHPVSMTWDGPFPADEKAPK